ncbi:MAG: DNA repair protein RecN [Candidatus Cloacimonadaceae bacterium]|nr:DNA repair protein RecN [Candidatus Cloacimonadaceae bacterium]MDP3114485.1 DNA repair protein RecN [Candidatus Cloacimonadaceae bacterium]
MLTEIFIQNYLFVPEQRLSFGKGMTVLSGETGAGKSILVGSISLIFAENSPSLEAFDPAKPIYLEACFDISANPEVKEKLAEFGYEIDDELTLARETGISGKSSYFLNGRKVSATIMKELKPLMIDFHHQREQQRLLSPQYQLELLDIYAAVDVEKAEFARLYKGLKSHLKELENLRRAEELNRQFIELYHYQYEELEKAGLRVDEDRELQQEFELLSHAKEIDEAASSIAQNLFEREDSAFDMINRAASELSRFAALNENIAQVKQSLSDCLEILSDSSSALAKLSENIVQDPQRLLHIQNRLDTINNLVYKHKAHSIKELISLFEERMRQIDTFADLNENIAALEVLLEKDFLTLREAGENLSELRRSAAIALSRVLQENIARLSIPDAVFEIRIDKKTDSKLLMHEYLAATTDSGIDGCVYNFSANQGAQLKSLAAVASGGELSRILLAIKKVLAERIPEKLIILDEIDAGIGGKTAEAVAEFIFRLATSHRIMCITHLAQIAAIAHQQVALKKHSGGGKTRIDMMVLDEQSRTAEIARMLSGSVSETAVKHAEELILKYKL